MVDNEAGNSLESFDSRRRLSFLRSRRTERSSEKVGERHTVERNLGASNH